MKNKEPNCSTSSSAALTSSGNNKLGAQSEEKIRENQLDMIRKH
jgi:hypothetical protein